MTAVGTTRFERLNSLAGLLALALFAALGVAWWRDRAQHYETPHWNAARFVALSPAVAPGALALAAEPGSRAPDDRALDGSSDSPEASTPSGELWLVAVNLDCAHCQQHLRALGQRTASRARVPRLAALIVDSPGEPRSFDLGVALAGGTWWDRDQVWRQSWGRRVYGETFRFDATGRLLSSTPAGVVPDSTASRM